MTDTITKEDKSVEEIVDDVKTLQPLFRERAGPAEEARRLPQESIDELVAAGLPRILAPRRFGGYEMGLDALLDVVVEVAKADASHGWCASLMIHHSHYIAQYPEEAEETIWADGPDVVMAASVLPVCEATEVEGGYRVSGRSPFTSGIAGSSWVMVGGFLQASGKPEWTFFLIAPDEYEVVDTWFTAGMRGTGSNTVVTEDVFVPETRVLRQRELRRGTAPGGKLNDGGIYRAPWYSYAPLTFISPMLGAALGAYEDFRSWTSTRKASGGGEVADFPAVQTRLGRVAATLDAAELLIRRAALAASEEPVAESTLVRSIRDYARASELIVESIDTLMRMSGTAGFAASSSIQRAWRDIHFASSHITLNPDTNFAHWGREEFGRPHPESVVF